MEPLTKVTDATVAVLTVLLEADGPCWGLEVIKRTGRASGTVYPILDRLERLGWVQSEWDHDAERRGPRRRQYHLTPTAAPEARRLCTQRLGRSPTRTTPRRGAIAPQTP